MTVRVDELTTDVAVEDEPRTTGAAGTPAPHWERLAAVRTQQERVLRDRDRTSAEAYGD
jgi:hypothetical protein